MLVIPTGVVFVVVTVIVTSPRVLLEIGENTTVVLAGIPVALKLVVPENPAKGV